MQSAYLTLSLDWIDILSCDFIKQYESQVNAADIVEIRFLSTHESALVELTDEIITALALLGKKKPLLIRVSAVCSFFFNTLKKHHIIPWMIDIPYVSMTTTKKHISSLRALFCTISSYVHIQVSYHDDYKAKKSHFKTQKNLRQFLAKLKTLSCDAIKCAITPPSLAFALDMLLYLQRRKEKNCTLILPNSDRLTLIAMGEKFSFYRVLGHFKGNFLNFTCLSNKVKALGQIDIDTFIHNYRIRDITQLDEIYVLMGSPVTQSMSHITHTCVLHALGQQSAIYVKIDTSISDIRPNLFHQLIQLQVQGLSITTPLKKHILTCLPSYQSILPINTISFKEKGKIQTANTDVLALQESISSWQSTHRNTKRHMVIIGSGSVAQSIGIFFLLQGWTVCYAARNIEKIEEDICKECEHIPTFNPLSISVVSLHSSCDRYKLHQSVSISSCVVNATSHEADSLLLQSLPADLIRHDALCVEFAYPHKSSWLIEVEKQGKKVVCGTQIWLQQATYQFHFWKIGCHHTREYLRNIMLEKLSSYMTKNGM